MKLVRARIGVSWIEFADGDEQPCPISPHEMGAPPKHLAKAGRLNSEGIPYLYLATKIDTAVAEVKPWIGSELTIGIFEILSDLRIVDASNDKPMSVLSLYEFINPNGQAFEIRKRNINSFTASEKEKFIWSEINSAFSRPISPNDTPLKYLSTQYLSEKFKTEGYDGLGYKSSLNQEGYNIALFNPRKAKCIGCRMYEIKQVEYKYEESGNPVSLSTDGEVLYQTVKILGRANVDKQGEKRKELNKKDI